jgi:adenine/guanine phosphoribosyltransferase-like PRPP-binding protein
MHIKTIGYALCLLTTSLSADIQKNYTVQTAIRKLEVTKGDFHYRYDFSSLFRNIVGLKTVIDIFHERYKDQKINGYIALTENAFAIATVLGYMQGVPVYYADKIEDLAENGYYVMICDIINSGKKIQKKIEDVQKQKCHVVEVASLTESPQLNGRSYINAQIFSIFIERFEKKSHY